MDTALHNQPEVGKDNSDTMINTEDFPTPAEVKGRKKQKHKWGPVIATRQSSRIAQDGKSILSKAQDLLSQKNLKVPTYKGNKFKHSFATVCNTQLANQAKALNICLSPTPASIHRQIDHLKNA